MENERKKSFVTKYAIRKGEDYLKKKRKEILM